jgi:hypothetical protein
VSVRSGLPPADPVVMYQLMTTSVKYVAVPGLLCGASVLLLWSGESAHEAGVTWLRPLWPVFAVAATVCVWGAILGSLTSLGATILAAVTSIRWGRSAQTTSSWPWVLASWLGTGMAWLWWPHLL